MRSSSTLHQQSHGNGIYISRYDVEQGDMKVLRGTMKIPLICVNTAAFIRLTEGTSDEKKGHTRAKVRVYARLFTRDKGGQNMEETSMFLREYLVKVWHEQDYMKKLEEGEEPQDEEEGREKEKTDVMPPMEIFRGLGNTDYHLWLEIGICRLDTPGDHSAVLTARGELLRMKKDKFHARMKTVMTQLIITDPANKKESGQVNVEVRGKIINELSDELTSTRRLWPALIVPTR